VTRLAISLWDFSWYTQAGPGEPFADVDAAFAQLVERGFNTVRICAAPFLLFSGQVDPAGLTVTGLGAEFGRRTRWYNVRGGYDLDALVRLEDLFAAAERYGCRVIVSSWEYQQSPCFVTSDRWYRALEAVPGPERAVVLADSLAALVDHLAARGLAGPLAYVELHNEVENGALVPGAGYARLAEPLARGAARFRARHPTVPVTYSMGEVRAGELDALPPGDVAHFHHYDYGVLGALYAAVGLGYREVPRRPVDQWPTDTLRALLRPDAPAVAEYRPDAGWQSAATAVRAELFYVHDWVDPSRWDGWLDAHFPRYRPAMRAGITGAIDAVAAFARRRGVPAVLGEGIVGYTPLLARFEEDAAGRGLAELAVRRCVQDGFWGVVPTSNAAPHHPMWWTDVDWMRRVNALITD
jgi:sugar-binding cellulase-like protein